MAFTKRVALAKGPLGQDAKGNATTPHSQLSHILRSMSGKIVGVPIAKDYSGKTNEVGFMERENPDRTGDNPLGSWPFLPLQLLPAHSTVANNTTGKLLTILIHPRCLEPPFEAPVFCY